MYIIWYVTIYCTGNIFHFRQKAIASWQNCNIGSFKFSMVMMVCFNSKKPDWQNHNGRLSIFMGTMYVKVYSAFIDVYIHTYVSLLGWYVADFTYCHHYVQQNWLTKKHTISCTATVVNVSNLATKWITYSAREPLISRIHAMPVH